MLYPQKTRLAEKEIYQCDIPMKLFVFKGHVYAPCNTKYYLGSSKTTNCVANDKDCRPRQSLSPKTEFVFWTTTKFVVDDRLCLWRQYLSFSNIKQKDKVCRWRQSLSSCNKVCLFVTVAEDKVCHGRQSLSQTTDFVFGDNVCRVR